jgi:FkbM family methyltransferase
LLAVRRHRVNWCLVRLCAVVTLTLVKAGPAWAERIRVFTYNGLLVGLCEDVTMEVNRRGLRLKLNLGDNVQRCLFFCGTYEDEYLRYLESRSQASDVYIDVGGHIGIDAFIVARRVGPCGRVICFEPSPDSAALIRRGAAENSLTESIEVVECGLGDEEGEFELRADPTMPAADSGVRSRYNDGPVVANARLRRFDNWASETSLDRIDIVKIDVEGGEHQVLLGMQESLAKFRPRAVLVEINDYRMEQAGTSTRLIDEALQSCGYVRSGAVFIENVEYLPISPA